MALLLRPSHPISKSSPSSPFLSKPGLEGDDHFGGSMAAHAKLGRDGSSRRQW